MCVEIWHQPKVIDSAGARLDLTVCDGAVHVYPLTPTPEGRAAARELVERVAVG